MRISDWSSDVCSSDLQFSLCVNISPRQFRQSDFVERIESCLATHGLPYAMLKLEITEGIVIQNLDDTIAKMRRLKNLGDRKSVVSGKSVSVRVDLDGRRIIKKKKYK